MSAAHDSVSPTMNSPSMNSGVAIAFSLFHLVQLARAAVGSLVARHRTKVALRALAEFDDHLLGDLGLSRGDIESPEALRAQARLRSRPARRATPANQNRTARAA